MPQRSHCVCAEGPTLTTPPIAELPMLPPGPITNHTLLLSDGVTPRPGLKKIKHYRGVNEATWLYLHSVYGGGPSLPRMTLDIYDTTPIKYLDGRGERK